ncbi:hypothetical protein ACFSSA_05325 [Luteolibacter algae]|uniref:Cytochrome c domain-containing protein n=1 Tax=Luteolibacter algae TaxID=454151 RepID=A0ABW5D5U8_9BACT
MPVSFQSTKHRQSVYNRPDQRWLCGNACKDCPCFLGPDPKGKCQAGIGFEGRVSGQCLPRRIGDRWLCTRQDTHGGEPCESGPLPDGSCCMSVPKCLPKRSLRSKRGIFTIAVTLATIVWLIAILTPDNDKLSDPMAGLDPGQLSTNHSFLENQCFRCHSDQDLSPAALTAMHGAATHHRAINDGELCLSCHGEIGGAGNKFAFAPHTSDQLPSRSAAKPQKNGKLLLLAASALSSKHLSDGGLHCATCHQEHHGETSDIATLSNKQCQVCHQEQFESFSDGHPEFSQSSYPYDRRTGIRFDHRSHYQTHFAEELKAHPETVPEGYDPAARHAESTSCTACHSSGKSGEPMSVKPFETSCAACHDGNTRAGEPLAFLAFPPLNKSFLDEKLAQLDPPRSLGTWIEEPANSFPWPTLQMLSPEAREAWERLRSAGVNPFDPALEAELDEAAVRDIETLAWAVKELARDLSQNQPHENPSNLIGQEELTHRLTQAGFPGAAELVKGIPASAFDAMRQGFSKNDYITLLAEVSAKRSGKFPEAIQPAGPDMAESTETHPPVENSEETFATSDDEFAGGEETFATGDDEFAGGEETFATSDDEFAGGEETFATGDDEFAGGEETFATGDDEFAGGEETLGNDDEFASSGEDPAAAEPEAPKELEAIDPITWAARGGWYEQYGALYYRSTGHADPLIRNWLDSLAANVSSPLALAQFKEGFDFLSGSESKASGSCLKCHAVDEIRDESGKLASARINWFSQAEAEARHSLTRYNHATHLLLTDCRSCHQTQTGGESFLTSFPESGDWDESADWSAKADPAEYLSNFKPIIKQTCVECHQPGKAGDGCIQCHVYHKDATHSISLPATQHPPAD